MARHKIPLETRTCLCECGTSFECKITSTKRFIHGHNARGILLIPRETRVCGCGCKETFVCKKNSKQRFIHGHHNKCRSQETIDKQVKVNTGKKRIQETKDKISTALTEYIRTQEHCDNISKAKKGVKQTQAHKDATGKAMRISATAQWKDPIIREKMLKAILAGSRKNPNGHELDLDKVLQEWFPGRYVLHGRVVAGKHPDFVDVKNKKIIEYNGSYYHSEERTGNTKEEEEAYRINIFKDVDYDCLIIWTDDLYGDLNVLRQKILEFDEKGK